MTPLFFPRKTNRVLNRVIFHLILPELEPINTKTVGFWRWKLMWQEKTAWLPHVFDLGSVSFGAGSAGWFVFNHVGFMEIQSSTSGESKWALVLLWHQSCHMGSRLDLFSGFFLWSFRKEGNGGCRFVFFKWDDHLNGIINGFSWGYFNLYTYRGYNPITTGRAGRGPPCRYAGGTFIGESDLCRQWVESMVCPWNS